MKWLALIACVILLAGCSYNSRGGKATFQTQPGFTGSVEQPENPKDETTGEYTETRPDGTQIKWTTKIGAAQKNTLAETAAKLRSMRPVMFGGIALFVFGAASLVYPPLKLIVGSSTTSALAIVAGLALTILPTVVVGHEGLILCVGGASVLVWWLARRHGEIHGRLKQLEK